MVASQLLLDKSHALWLGLNCVVKVYFSWKNIKKYLFNHREEWDFFSITCHLFSFPKVIGIRVYNKHEHAAGGWVVIEPRLLYILGEEALGSILVLMFMADLKT